MLFRAAQETSTKSDFITHCTRTVIENSLHVLGSVMLIVDKRSLFKLYTREQLFPL